MSMVRGLLEMETEASLSSSSDDAIFPVDIIVRGKSGSGKTSTILTLLRALSHSPLHISARGCVGQCVFHHCVPLPAMVEDGDESCRESSSLLLRFWDAAESIALRFRYMEQQLPKYPHCVLYVFSCGDPDSLAHIERQLAGDDETIPVVVIGTMKYSRFGITESMLEEFQSKWPRVSMFSVENSVSSHTDFGIGDSSDQSAVPLASSIASPEVQVILDAMIDLVSQRVHASLKKNDSRPT